MRFVVLAGLALVASPTVLAAQTAATPAPAASPAPGYSTANTDLGTLLDNPATKAVLMKYIPQMVNNDQIAMARSMTLKSLQQYAGESLTDATLAKIDADLAKVPVKG